MSRKIAALLRMMTPEPCVEAMAWAYDLEDDIEPWAAYAVAPKAFRSWFRATLRDMVKSDRCPAELLRVCREIHELEPYVGRTPVQSFFARLRGGKLRPVDGRHPADRWTLRRLEAVIGPM